MAREIPLVKDSLLYAPLVLLEKELNVKIGLLPAKVFVNETPPLLVIDDSDVVAVIPDRFMCSAVVVRGRRVSVDGVDGYVWENAELRKFDYCYLPPKIIRSLEKYFVDGGESAGNG